jgi:hypothetical protein
MDEPSISGELLEPEAGLCGSCRFSRWIENRRGSRFLLCRLSETDGRFRKYPALPVLRCDGYEKAAASDRETQG